MSRGRIKPANKQYSSVKNDYELFFQSDTIVEEVQTVYVVNRLFHVKLM